MGNRTYHRSSFYNEFSKSAWQGIASVLIAKICSVFVNMKKCSQIRLSQIISKEYYHVLEENSYPTLILIPSNQNLLMDLTSTNNIYHFMQHRNQRKLTNPIKQCNGGINLMNRKEKTNQMKRGKTSYHRKFTQIYRSVLKTKEGKQSGSIKIR